MKQKRVYSELVIAIIIIHAIFHIPWLVQWQCSVLVGIYYTFVCNLIHVKALPPGVLLGISYVHFLFFFVCSTLSALSAFASHRFFSSVHRRISWTLFCCMCCLCCHHVSNIWFHLITLSTTLVSPRHRQPSNPKRSAIWSSSATLAFAQRHCAITTQWP